MPRQALATVAAMGESFSDSDDAGATMRPTRRGAGGVSVLYPLGDTPTSKAADVTTMRRAPFV